MAITVKSLAYGSLAVSTDTNLYPSGASTYAAKSVIVKNMRFVNPSDTTLATLLLKLKQDTPSSTRQISSGTVTIPPKGFYLVNEELTLEGNIAGGTKRHAILATASGTAIDYVISGIERD